LSDLVKKRNPKWNRDELILVLDLYLKNYPKIPDKKSEIVLSLSDLLNNLELKLSGTTGSTFRNANGVYMKMMNFHAINPAHEGKGLKAGAKLDRVIWDEFSDDKDRLFQIADAIREAVSGKSNLPLAAVAEDPSEQDAQEGRILTRIHKYYERDPKLVKRKKAQVLSELGKLECECCQFDFMKVYGKRGEDYIECHHKNPVSELKKGQRTKLADLALVCSNCHRMIHRFRPWLTIEQLKKIIEASLNRTHV